MLKNLLQWIKNLFTKVDSRISTEPVYELKYLFYTGDKAWMTEFKILGLPEDTPKDKKYYWAWLSNDMIGPLTFREMRNEGDIFIRLFSEGVFTTHDNDTQAASMVWREGTTTMLTRVDPNELPAEFHEKIVNFVNNKKTWSK